MLIELTHIPFNSHKYLSCKYEYAARFGDLFDLILYGPSTNFQLNRDGSSWVEPV